MVFDNTDTEGYGISAVVRTIEGKSVSSYSYELIDDVPHGVVECAEPHDLLATDRVLVDYTPSLANELETYKVKVVDGIEQINVTQIGTGYNDDVPISVEIDGVGQHAAITPIIDIGNGTVSEFNIVRSGNGFTTAPKLVISHPQSFKKAEYFLNNTNNLKSTVHNGIFTDDSTKDYYVCGNTLDEFNNRVGYVAKYSQSGDVIWSKTARSEQPSGQDTYCDFATLYVDITSPTQDVYVTGTTKPNSLNINYNLILF